MGEVAFVCATCGRRGQGPRRARCTECRELFDLVAADGVSQAVETVFACAPDGHHWFCSSRCAGQYESLRQLDARLAGQEPGRARLVFPDPGTEDRTAP